MSCELCESREKTFFAHILMKRVSHDSHLFWQLPSPESFVFGLAVLKVFSPCLSRFNFFSMRINRAKKRKFPLKIKSRIVLWWTVQRKWQQIELENRRFKSNSKPQIVCDINLYMLCKKDVKKLITRIYREKIVVKSRAIRAFLFSVIQKFRKDTILCPKIQKKS